MVTSFPNLYSNFSLNKGFTMTLHSAALEAEPLRYSARLALETTLMTVRPEGANYQ
jgi:hypothetical protein